MKKKLNLNKYDIAFLVGFTFWIITTALFGFNEKAISVVEKMCDQISIVLVIYGSIGSFFSNLKTTININANSINIPEVN